MWNEIFFEWVFGFDGIEFKDSLVALLLFHKTSGLDIILANNILKISF